MVSVDPQRVELKLSIGAGDVKKAKKWLGLKDGEATQATIWFCDQPRSDGDGDHFDLFDRGVIVRLRRKYGDDSNTTIKYRREAPFVLPPGWDPEVTPDFKVEGDWTIQSRKVAASLDSTVADATIDEAGRNGPPLPSGLFSHDQRQFVADLVAPHAVDLAALRPLGPIDAQRWEEAPRKDLNDKVGAERWRYDGLEFLELSIRVRFENAEEWLSRFADWATDGGINVTSLDKTKTQAVLEHFAQRLAP
jgi:hypothetical protein